MKACFLYIVLLIWSVMGVAQISEFIHADQFGYPTNSSKIGVISNPQIGFNSSETFSPSSTLQLRDFTNDNIVLTESVTPWSDGHTHIQSGDTGWHFDFSSYQIPGKYYIYDATHGESSAPFSINANPYLEVLNTATKMYYYNRCNHSKDAQYVQAGFEDPINFVNHFQDQACRYVYDQNNISLEKDLTGGWFDAGDYNKYVTFAHTVIHDLIGAYERSPDAFGDDISIPESQNGTVDLLDELKWELDWLMKMTNPDGTAHLKMGSISHQENNASPPSNNTDQRFYGPPCTSASIAIASMFARSAIVYKDLEGHRSFAQILEERAIECWEYFIMRFNNDTLEYDCDDGTIVAGDADWDYTNQRDAAVVAATYLYELTGNNGYQDFFLSQYADTQPINGNYWGPYRMPINEALLRYTANPNANSIAKTAITYSATDALINNWEGYYLPSDTDLYIAYVPDYMYNWGSNQTKASLANMCLLFIEYNLVPSLNDQLEEKALSHLHYLHGVNPFGLVMLSNMYSYGGDRCVDEVYHTWFANGTEYNNVLQDDYGPAPGFVTGGPNSAYSGSVTPPAGQPIMKSYAQWNTGYPENSWEITEPAIYYQSAYIRLLSYFVNSTMVTNQVNITAENNCIQIHPNPVNNYFNVSGLLDRYTIQIVNSNGHLVQTISGIGSEAAVDTSTLGSGTFFIVVQNIDHQDVCVKKIVRE